MTRKYSKVQQSNGNKKVKTADMMSLRRMIRKQEEQEALIELNEVLHASMSQNQKQYIEDKNKSWEANLLENAAEHIKYLERSVVAQSGEEMPQQVMNNWTNQFLHMTRTSKAKTARKLSKVKT